MNSPDSNKFIYYSDPSVTDGVTLRVVREYYTYGTAPSRFTLTYAPEKYIIRQIGDYAYLTYSYINKKYHSIVGWNAGNLSVYYDSKKFSGGFGYLKNATNIKCEELSSSNSQLLNYSYNYPELTEYLQKITGLTD